MASLVCMCCASCLGNCAGKCLGACLMSGKAKKQSIKKWFAIYQVVNVVLVIFWRYFIVTLIIMPIDINQPGFAKLFIIQECYGHYGPNWRSLAEASTEDISGGYESCLQQQVTNRQCFTMFLLLIFCILISLFGGANYVCLKFWVLKYVLLLLLPVAFFFMPSYLFNWVDYLAVSCSSVFLIMQMMILYDLSYAWNNRWIDHALAEQRQQDLNSTGRGWFIALLTCSIIFLIIALILVVLISVFYGSSTWRSGGGVRGESWQIQPFIWIPWFLGVVFLSISLTEWSKYGAFLPSSVINLYFTLIMWMITLNCPWVDSGSFVYVRPGHEGSGNPIDYRASRRQIYSGPDQTGGEAWPRVTYGRLTNDKNTLVAVGILLMSITLFVFIRNPSILLITQVDFYDHHRKDTNNTGEDDRDDLLLDEETVLYRMNRHPKVPVQDISDGTTEHEEEVLARGNEGGYGSGQYNNIIIDQQDDQTRTTNNNFQQEQDDHQTRIMGLLDSDDEENGKESKKGFLPELDRYAAVTFLFIHLIAPLHVRTLFLPEPNWYSFVVLVLSLFTSVTFFGYAIIAPQCIQGRDWGEGRGR